MTHRKCRKYLQNCSNILRVLFPNVPEPVVMPCELNPALRTVIHITFDAIQHGPERVMGHNMTPHVALLCRTVLASALGHIWTENRSSVAFEMLPVFHVWIGRYLEILNPLRHISKQNGER